MCIVKKFILIILSVLLTALPGYASDDDGWTSTITPEITLEAIKIFRENPSGEDARSALALIVRFTKESKDVTVTISPNYLPWEQGTLSPYLEGVFLGAFVAGNIEYQLLHKINQNRPFEGIKLMLYSYKVLKDRDKIEALENFDTWLVLDQQNQLYAELDL